MPPAPTFCPGEAAQSHSPSRSRLPMRGTRLPGGAGLGAASVGPGDSSCSNPSPHPITLGHNLVLFLKPSLWGVRFSPKLLQLQAPGGVSQGS